MTEVRPLPTRRPRSSPTRSAGGSRCAGCGPARCSSCPPRTASAAGCAASTTCRRQVCEFPYLNPVTGPFHVEGAEPGDTLAVHFVEIVPARDWAVSIDVPALRRADRHPHHGDAAPAAGGAWCGATTSTSPPAWCATTPGAADFTVELPLDPMHGTVGVAPAAFEAPDDASRPDAHGGNMDTPELRAGVTAYFGVNVPGALFALGDGHCRQGDGEVCGTGVEAAMNTVVVVDVIKGAATPWPRLETDAALMSTGSARPLEDAYRISQHDLVTWTADADRAGHAGRLPAGQPGRRGAGRQRRATRTTRWWPRCAKRYLGAGAGVRRGARPAARGGRGLPRRPLTEDPPDVVRREELGR